MSARVCVVTGSEGGIGSAIVRVLRTSRWKVVGIDVAVSGDGSQTIVGDAGDPTVVEQALEAVRRLGHLAGWVNNAAVFDDADLVEDGAERVLAILDAHLRACAIGCAAAVREFARVGSDGSIVNISSHQALRPVPGALAYSTAKAAVEGLTRALAVDHGARGIRVNALALGSIRTGRYDEYLRGLTPGERERVTREMARVHPLGRVGEPEEVAHAVEFLLSPESSYLTGAVIPLDGGRSARGVDPEER